MHHVCAGGPAPWDLGSGTEQMKQLSIGRLYHNAKADISR